MNLLALLGAGASVLAVARSAAHQKHPLRAVLAGAACGLAGLALVNLLAPYTGVLLPLNRFTAFVGVVLGLPGVIALLVLNAIFL
ncbi:MAG: pro-sigmaK processing inhibitor BofA family protein [Gemmiger sp.]|nr:pro-sigmaK processing inhibitor BofA family protein [Gemmiger sp.]